MKKIILTLFILFYCVSPSFATWCDDALICYTMEEGSGDATCDQSPSGNDGTFIETGGPAWTSTSTAGAWSSYSLDFDGSNDRVAFDSNVSLTEGKTLAIWLKPDSVSTRAILGRSVSGSDSSIWIWNSTTIRVISADTNAKDFTVSTLTAGVGFWLFVEHDASSNYRVWVNNTESTTGALNSTVDLQNIDCLGRGWGSDSYLYNGIQDDFMIIEKTLTSDERTHIMANGLDSTYSSGSTITINPIIMVLD